MKVRIGMSTKDCGLLWQCDSSIQEFFDAGSRIIMTPDGQMVICHIFYRPTKLEISDFENRSVFFHLIDSYEEMQAIMTDGYITGELNFNPALYRDDRMQKFFAAKDMVVPTLLIDSATDRISAIRDIILDEATKQRFNEIWGKLYELNLPQKEFQVIYGRTICSVPVTTNLRHSTQFGKDTLSRAKREIEIDVPNYRISEDLKGFIKSANK